MRGRRRPSGACGSPERSPTSGEAARWCSRVFSLARFLVLLRRVALDVLLICPRDSQRTWGNVLGDHRPGPSVCVVADFYGSDEGGVNPGVNVLPDLGAIFVAPVVVRRDGAGSEVGPLPHLGVADVGEVGNLGAGADLGVLDLHEAPGLGALA